MAQPAESEAHGNFAGQRADGAGGDRIYAALLQVPGIVELILVLGEILAAAARADHHADSAQLVARHGAGVKTGILQRLPHAGHRQRNGARDVGTVLRLHIARFVEFVGNFTRNLHDKSGWVEARDAAHPADAGPRGRPITFPPDSVRADRADSCDGYSMHGLLSIVG